MPRDYKRECWKIKRTIMNMRAKYKGILYDASFKSETEVIIM